MDERQRSSVLRHRPTPTPTPTTVTPAAVPIVTTVAPDAVSARESRPITAVPTIVRVHVTRVPAGRDAPARSAPTAPPSPTTHAANCHPSGARKPSDAGKLNGSPINVIWLKKILSTPLNFMHAIYYIVYTCSDVAFRGFLELFVFLLVNITFRTAMTHAKCVCCLICASAVLSDFHRQCL